MAGFERPHFRHPFQRGSYVEQDTPEHIRSCQRAIAECPVGARAERPEFGWPIPFMRPMPVDFQPLVDALVQFEPRDTTVTVAQAESVYGETVQVTTPPEAQSVD